MKKLKKRQETQTQLSKNQSELTFLKETLVNNQNLINRRENELNQIKLKNNEWINSVLEHQKELDKKEVRINQISEQIYTLEKEKRNFQSENEILKKKEKDLVNENIKLKNDKGESEQFSLSFKHLKETLEQKDKQSFERLNLDIISLKEEKENMKKRT